MRASRYSPAPLSLLFFVAPLIVIPPLRDFANLPQAAWLQVGCLLTASVLLGLRVFQRNPVPVVIDLSIVVPVMAFTIWGLLSYLWSLNSYEWSLTANHWSACALLFVIAHCTLRSARDVLAVMRAIFFAAVIVAVLGICQSLFDLSFIPHVASPASTFANKNFAAQYLVAALPLGVGLWLTGSSKRLVRGILTLGVAAIIAFLILSVARAAWLAVAGQFLIGIPALWWYTRAGRLHSPAKVLIGVGVVIVTVTAIYASGISWTLTEPIERGGGPMQSEVGVERVVDAGQQTTGQRIAIWLNTVAIIDEHLWTGVGLGNHKVFYPAFARVLAVDQTLGLNFELEHVHNDFLQLLAELGCIGGLLLAWAMVAFLWCLRKAWRATPPAPYLIVIASLVLAMLGIIFNSLASSPLQRALPPAVFALAAGAVSALALRLQNRRNPSVNPLRVTVATPVAVVGLLAMLSFSVWNMVTQYQRLNASAHYALAGTAEARGNWSTAIAEGLRVLDYTPAQTKALLYVGVALGQLRRYTQAEEALGTVLQSYPYQLNALSQLAYAQSRAGRYDAALETYRRALAIKPDAPLFHLDIGEILEARGDIKRALEAYATVASLVPKDAAMWHKIGVLAGRTEDYALALSAFEEAASLTPDSAIVHRDLGVLLYYRLQRPNDGVAHFEQALAINPQITGAADLKRVIRGHLRDFGSVPIDD